MRIRRLILLFGILNACLFSCMLPLWEGFDEGFHYSYIETLWQTRRFPVLGSTRVAGEVSRSFELAPDHYGPWFELPEPEKERRRAELERLRPEAESGPRLNREAQHPPLAYLILAALSWPMWNAPIPERVLVLRLFCGVCSVLLLYFGALALFRALRVPERYANAALFTTFCSEMLYATVAHVDNDWLAVGISAMLLAALADLAIEPTSATMWRTAAWLAAGLLTKAYFLVLAAPVAAVVVMLIWRGRLRLRAAPGPAALVLALAAPWYVRNLVLYGNIAGTQEAAAGIGIRQTLAAAARIDWIAMSGFVARGSLWTGNNSFTTFSRNTLNLELALFFLALAAWAFHRKAIQMAERIQFATIVLFSIAVAYHASAQFAFTDGAGFPIAGPWYTQVLLAPALGLAYLGMSRWMKWGAILAIGTVAIWTWVEIASWTIKLFPTYSAGAFPMRPRDIWNWWTHGAAAHAHDLSLLALAPAPLLYIGLAILMPLGLGLSGIVMRDLTSAWREGSA